MIDLLRRRRRSIAPDQCSVPPTVWFRAHDLGAALADGGAVGAGGTSNATNLGSLGGNWSQGTAGARPAYRENVLNTWGAIDFDGTDDQLLPSAGITLAGAISATAYEFLAVALFEAISTASGTITSNDNLIAQNSVDWGLYATSAPDLKPFHNDGAAVSVTLPIALNRWYLVRWRFETGTLFASLGDDGEVSVAGGAVAGTSGTIRLGGRSAGTPIDARLAELAIWNVNRPAHERFGVREYFREKYGV
jgi:hypothetical protein